MTKIALLASTTLALSLVAGSAFAQSSTPILNSGLTANEALVIQRGTSNNALVEQEGTNNKAGKLNSNATITVDLLSTGSIDSAFDASSTVLQLGDRNNLSIKQSGSGNQIVTATGNRTGNPSSPTLGNGPFKDNNGGSFQNGYENNANVVQDGTNGKVLFQQASSNNTANVTAFAGANNTEANVYQFGGNRNYAEVNQYGSASNTTAYVIQDGTSNGGVIKQAGVNNFAAVIQHGDRNSGVIEQYGNTNYAATFQNGYDNNGSILQATNNVGAFGYQSGTSNYGRIEQTGGGFANAAFAQVGNNNSITMRQK